MKTKITLDNITIKQAVNYYNPKYVDLLKKHWESIGIDKKIILGAIKESEQELIKHALINHAKKVYERTIQEIENNFK